jgi:UDP-3-O-[3-hydroxymyristoyl] glucosamine N-acyltransferase
MKVRELSRLLGGELHGEGDSEIHGVAGLEEAGPHDLTFAEGARAVGQAQHSRASCILVPQGVTIAGRTSVAVSHPKLAFIRAAEALLPKSHPQSGIHPTAVVAPSARIAASASIGPHVVIEDHVTVGERTVLKAGVFLGAGCQVGADCVLHPRVTVYEGARIGDRVILHAGAVIGSDGFGYVFGEGRQHKFPQLGGVRIENDVEVGSNSTVDRGSLGTTVIGEGTKLDNLVQVAHNVKIGRHCVIAAQTGISGSCEIGDFVMMGGQAGLGDHVRVADRCVIGGQAGILPGKVVREGATLWGTPARPFEEFRRIYVHYSRLPEMAKLLKELSDRI